MTGPNPTDRGKLGTKRHVLTDGQGIPLSVIVTAANTHDMKAAINTLDNIVVKRPSYKINKEKQNLCLDKGYDFLEIENGVIKKGYLPHIRHRGEQSVINGSNHHHHARRWVVERTNSWHNKFRKLFCVSMFRLLHCYLQVDNFGIGS
ncbi:MAG: transposase [Nitrososphaeraceae archaeon]